MGNFPGQRQPGCWPWPRQLQDVLMKTQGQDLEQLRQQAAATLLKAAECHGGSCLFLCLSVVCFFFLEDD